jgi:RNA polymerase sigma-70 factor (ECF subfamily)
MVQLPVLDGFLRDKRLTPACVQAHIAGAGAGNGWITSVSKSSTECVQAETLPSRDAGVDAFVREHQAELLNFFRGRVARPQDAADLAQESWSRMMHYRLDTVASSRGLLFTIARNVLKNHWRWSALRQIEQSTDFTELEVSSDAPGPDRHLQAAVDLEALEAAVVALPPKCRTVFLLSRIEGLSNAEVAQRCGISVKMVEKHLAKAIVTCRAQVGDFDT